MKWIVNFILEQGDKDVRMILFVEAKEAGIAMEEAHDALDAKYPNRHFAISGMDIAEDQDRPYYGLIDKDPYGRSSDDDIKMLAWWRRVES